MTSAQQLAANPANAQLSTGPKTEAGKAISSRNAVKTGLTGRTILLPTDEAAQYEEHLLNAMLIYDPVGPAELALVQSIADTDWRLYRIPLLEFGIYSRGNNEFAELFLDTPAAERPHLIRDRTQSTYQKEFRNLQIQEGRLRRYRRQDLEELRQRQKERLDKAEAERELAEKVGTAAASKPAASVGQPPVLPAQVVNGFDFSPAANSIAPGSQDSEKTTRDTVARASGPSNHSLLGCSNMTLAAAASEPLGGNS